MDGRTIGIEVEMTGLLRGAALDIAAKFLHATEIVPKPPNYIVYDRQGRKWRVDYDNSILLLKNTPSGMVATTDEAYAVELVSPVLCTGQVSLYTDLIAELKNAGAVLSESCGLHVHIGGAGHTADSLKRLVSTVHGYGARLLATLQINRKRRAYCGFPKDCLVERLEKLLNPTLREIEDAWYHGNKQGKRRFNNDIRKQFVNLHTFFHGIGTIEYRGFNASLEPKDIQRCVDIALALDEAARTGETRKLDGLLIHVPKEREREFAVKPKIRFAR